MPRTQCPHWAEAHESETPSAERESRLPELVRFLLVHWLVQSVIGSTVTGDRAERLQCDVLPTDDPVRAMNILREAAGLQPLSNEHDDQGG